VTTLRTFKPVIVLSIVTILKFDGHIFYIFLTTFTCQTHTWYGFGKSGVSDTENVISSFLFFCLVEPVVLYNIMKGIKLGPYLQVVLVSGLNNTES